MKEFVDEVATSKTTYTKAEAILFLAMTFCCWSVVGENCPVSWTWVGGWVVVPGLFADDAGANSVLFSL